MGGRVSERKIRSFFSLSPYPLSSLPGTPYECGRGMDRFGSHLNGTVAAVVVAVATAASVLDEVFELQHVYFLQPREIYFGICLQGHSLLMIEMHLSTAVLHTCL